MMPLIERKARQCSVMNDELPHPGGLPVSPELLQVLMDGVDGLVNLVHAILKKSSASFIQASWFTVQTETVRACQRKRVDHDTAEQDRALVQRLLSL
jgi:hypothetical protein